MRKRVIYLTQDQAEVTRFRSAYADEIEVEHFDNSAAFLASLNADDVYAAFITSSGMGAFGLSMVQVLREDLGFTAPIFYFTDATISPKVQESILDHGVTDIFNLHPDKEMFLTRLNYLVNPKNPTTSNISGGRVLYKMPTIKRAFDIIFSGFALLILSPLFLIVAILVKLESKGPAFYFSYRVGTNYKIFKFWKFRSMRQDADKMLSSMKDLNQYQVPKKEEQQNSAFTLCETCAINDTNCQNMLYDKQGQIICEKQYQEAKKADSGPAFMKISNDPRITRIGKFLRNTSIDELPQLYNVLRGDMSIVGNRPLPLYEAEKLTTDSYATRFIAPAGITGLWQVIKRGKGGDMSEEERKALDIEYAENYSLKKDLEIILKTIPALYQKENV